MRAGILAIWSIGLAGALFPTVSIFRTGRLLTATLEKLLTLSQTIGRAAHGIDRNVSTIPASPEAR